MQFHAIVYSNQKLSQPVLSRIQRYETAFSVINDGLNHALSGTGIEAVRNVNKQVAPDPLAVKVNDCSEYTLRTPNQLGSAGMACRDWFEGIYGGPSVEPLDQQFCSLWRSVQRSG